MVRYFEDGIYDLSPNKISTTVENNRVWCDTYIENQERWQILQRAPGVNEYTYVHCDSVFNMLWFAKYPQHYC